MKYFDILETLVKQNSYSNSPENVNKISSIIKDYLSDLNIISKFDWKEYESDSRPLGKLIQISSKEINPKLPNLTVSGHMDTVYKNHDKFDIRKEGTLFYGPGTIDMKAGIVVMLATVIELTEKHGPIPNLQIILTPDEEIVSNSNFPQLKELMADQTHCMVFEGDGSSNYDNKRKSRNVVVQRKGAIMKKFEATGVAAHSGVVDDPEKRHSAIHELLKIAQTVVALADDTHKTTTNVGVFKGGISHNAIAEHAEIHVDSRVKTFDEYDRIKEEFDKLPDLVSDPKVSLEVSEIANIFPLMFSKQNKEFLDLAVMSGKKIGREIQPEFRGGGSDANRFAYFNKNMAILDNFGPAGGEEHSFEEYLHLDSIRPSIDFSKQVITDLLKLNG